ncbi:cholesterol 24-hydroxylase-like [Notechis scutatus]|nr:cholesterol 24-hydroxylase-like [Notechis scutatus]
MRWTEKKNVIEGIDIPANTTLFFSTYLMGRMERYFKNALTFDPDRFSKDKSRPYFSYFPFSLGPRSCIGQLFAQVSKIIALRMSTPILVFVPFKREVENLRMLLIHSFSL